MSKSQTTLAVLTALILAACAAPVRGPAPVSVPVRGPAPPSSSVSAPACPVCPVCPQTPMPVQPPAKPLQPAAWEDLPGWVDDDLVAAWPGFMQTCRGLASRAQWPLWRPACEAARGVDPLDGVAQRRFFQSQLAPYRVVNPDGSDSGLITGYYEPLLNGSREPRKAAVYPVYGVPDDLLTIDLGDVYPELKPMRLRGRIEGRKVVPYWSRAEIEQHRDSLPARTLLWVEDPVELFFLQIQGSGRVRLPGGEMVRLGYADQNGHPYQSIGKVLLDRGDLKPGEASMQGIQAWARANPEKLPALLDANPSYVFFREMPANGDGPIGALGVPLSAGRSVAVDPRTIPLGAPLFLATTRPQSGDPLRRLMLAQDTGGAIRGAVRADFFWGFGPEAGSLAGRMKQSGRIWVLLPPGVVSRDAP